MENKPNFYKILCVFMGLIIAFMLGQRFNISKNDEIPTEETASITREVPQTTP